MSEGLTSSRSPSATSLLIPRNSIQLLAKEYTVYTSFIKKTGVLKYVFMKFTFSTIAREHNYDSQHERTFYEVYIY